MKINQIRLILFSKTLDKNQENTKESKTLKGCGNRLIIKDNYECMMIKLIAITIIDNALF
jgi:hypothetical protein